MQRMIAAAAQSEISVPSGQARLRFELGQFAEGNVEVRDRLRLAA